MSALEDNFALYWNALKGPPLVTQYKFHAGRKWRLDFAHPETKTAIEIDGGNWINGRHNRGSGRKLEAEKLRHLARAGWKVFPFVTGDITANNIQMVIDHIHENTTRPITV